MLGDSKNSRLLIWEHRMTYGSETMSITQLIPLVESLPQPDKLRLMQILLSNIARDEGVSLQDPSEAKGDRGQSMASVLQRMAGRQALSSIADPLAWQHEIRTDRPLPGRE